MSQAVAHAAVATVGGVTGGFALTSLRPLVELHLGVFGVANQDSARAVLQTIATATVSVAGLSFSVTLVALTLAAQQLSPRVLRTFRADRVAQLTLASFLGTFAYALVVLARLGAISGQRVPEFSVTLAIALALASFGMFVAFIGDIVVALQASTVIARIAADAQQAIDGRSPRGVGRPADDPGAAGALASLAARGAGIPARAASRGYLTHLDRQIIDVAHDHACLIEQHVPVGQYVVHGQVLARAWPVHGEDVRAPSLASSFILAPERTIAADPAFAVRQLADIALRALSPGVNDPTTAENAMSALTDVLTRFAADAPLTALRANHTGQPRLLALAASVDELILVGFEEVIEAARDQTVVQRRLRELLLLLRDSAPPASPVITAMLKRLPDPPGL